MDGKGTNKNPMNQQYFENLVLFAKIIKYFM